MKRLRKFIQKRGHITNKLALDIAEILLQTAVGRRIGRAILLARNGLERRREIIKSIDEVVRLIVRFLQDVSHSATSQRGRSNEHSERSCEAPKPQESSNARAASNSRGTRPRQASSLVRKTEKGRRRGGIIGKRAGAWRRRAFSGAQHGRSDRNAQQMSDPLPGAAAAAAAPAPAPALDREKTVAPY
ncbi:MAG: hypothetical protein GY820_24200 [Gammaproteobacteria bacterium]|nr:hypothetical protein [Gammaproteobacteria bacterium]